MIHLQGLRSGVLLVVLAFLAVACGGGGDGAATPGSLVQDRFAAGGPATALQAAAADSTGMTYTVYYPATFATDGYLNPLIAYGNGSFAACTGDLARTIGRHLASWGFVVVCPDHSQTGLGTEILQAVRFMVAENSRAGSMFQGQLDTSAIGASGHSQGATGALNANSKAAGAIRSTVTLAFVDPSHHGIDQPRLGEVTGPVLLVSGCSDPLTTRQDDYFDALPTAAAKACRVGAAHGDIVHASLGYTTAWFMYTLRGDAQARGAFLAANGAAPEMALSPDWLGWRAKLLH